MVNRDNQDLWDQVEKRAPASQWQIVTVTFPAIADTDIDIVHTLSPVNPEAIDYEVLRANGPPLVYHNSGPTRSPWQKGLVRLRSSIANLKADVLLTVSADKTRPTIDAVVQPLVTAITGEGKLWFTATPPTGWLICDGSSLLRASFAALFAVIGTTFGAVDGTHFSLPDFRRRVPVGSGGAGTAALANTLGAVGGAETHQLVTAELPSHTHTQNAHTHTQNSHTHGMSGGLVNSNNAVGAQVCSSNNAGTSTAMDTQGYAPTATTATNQNTTATNNNTGSDTAHNNLQPSLVVNYIIKT